ncbi:tape measure protein [Clostridium sp.]|uniref:tape measure protein n=1 Tax=Clostridium sp. TaxID=1506 RepID=UPI003217E70E
MIIIDGRIIIDTDLDTQGIESDIGKLGGKLNGVAQKGLKAFTATVAAAGTALVGLGTVGVKYNAQMEQYMSSFTTMLGSADEAAKHLEELKVFAAKTPFELPDLANASTTLQAFGIDVKDITPTLKMLGDIALGDSEKFKGLSLVFGQVSSQGKLTGQDLMQMINQGFNPLQIISEKTGKSMADLKDEMSKGQISFEMVADAMKTATSEGGKFYNAMEGQSQTLVGQWSTLADNATALLGDMFKPISDALTNKVLPAINTAIESISESLNNGELQESVSKIAEGFGNLAAAIAEGLVAILPAAIELLAWILDNGAGIATIIGTIVTAMVAFKAGAVLTGVVKSWQEAKLAIGLYQISAQGATVTQGVMNGVFTVWETIVALMTGKTTLAAAATGLWTKAVAALNAMWAANPIGIVIVAIVALVGAFVYLWNTSEGFRNFFINMWNSIKEAFVNTWNAIMDFFTTTIPAWIESMKQWFSDLGAWFGELWTSIKQWFVDGWNGIVTFFTESIPAWWEGVKQAFADGWNAVVAFFTETIPAWLEQMFNWFMELPYKIGYALTFALTTIKNWLVETIETFIQGCKNIVYIVTEWFMKLPGVIWEWLVNAYNNIVQWASDTWNKFVETCINIYNSVTEWFSKLPGMIWDWLVNAYNKTVQWGQNTWNTMVEYVSNAINAVIEWFAKLPGRIWEWLVNTVNKVIDWGSNLASEGAKAGGELVESIINVVKELPSKFFDIGVNIVKGIWEGIKSVGSWLNNMVTGFFDGMLDGAKDANKICSPSKLYRDEVGKYMAQGVGVGFEDEADNVQRTMEKDFERMASKMQATVDYNMASTTAGIVARNNNFGTSTDSVSDSTNSRKQVIENHIHVDVEGKELAYAISPYQDVLSDYYSGR